MADNKVLTFIHSGGTREFVRPVPLISISRESLRNEMGSFGASYTITLTGTLLDNRGGISSTNDIPGQVVEDDEAAYEIFAKQNKLKELFSEPDLQIEICNVEGNATPDKNFHVILQSLDFEEGIYVNICKYTAVFTAEFMYDDNDVIHQNDLMALLIETSDSNKSYSGDHDGTPTAQSLRTQFGGLIKDLGETWSIQVDETSGSTNKTEALEITSPRSYVVTRESTIVGRTYYDSINDEKHEAWSEAKKFADKMVLTDAVEEYPGYAEDKKFASLVLNLSKDFGGFNHSRVESIDKATGTVNITDVWVMCEDSAFENYNASINSALDSPYVAVTLNGTIKGLSSIPASGEYYGGDAPSNAVKPYENALKKYNQVAGDGAFGINSYVYKRANSVVQPGLNPQPQSIALAENKFDGTITYSLTFDNRPQNIISEALSENITVNDTYPGDLYALIPVVGRPSGPVMQYIGGRTEYRRDLSIELFFDYTDVDYGNNGGAGLRTKLISSKPSVNDSVKGKLMEIIKQTSPMSEPKLRKCFLNPPQESWNAKEARYTLSMSWVYELQDANTSDVEEENPPRIPFQTP